MNARHLAIAALFALAAACASTPACAADPPDSARQLLVMLRMPAPHLRPDLAYGGAYDTRAGRDARRRVAEALASQYGLRIVDDWPMPALGVDCIVMQAPGGESLEALAERIARDARVESAQAMSVFRVLAHDDPLYPLQPAATAWHLAEMHRLATGRSVRIAEIDTAVDVANPDLDGQVALARDFVGDRAPSEMHGTAVAGIIAARADNGVGIAGVAPDARLLALRACRQTSADNPAATCTTFALAKALQFALDARADVLNLSVGGPRDRLLERLLDVASARGVTIVAAADPAVRDGGFPAGHLGVLAIGADGAHDLADGLLRAPGIDVPTTLAGNRFGFVSGSSYAAAHVSGLVALLRELAPTLTPRQIRDALQTHALPGNGPASGLIVDACAALERTAGACACACTAREERAALR